MTDRLNSATLLQAIAQLRSMWEQYEYDNRGIGPDFYEVNHFLEWTESKARANQTVETGPT